MNEVTLLVSIVVVAALFLGFLAWALCRAAASIEPIDDGRAFGGDE